MKRIKFPKVSTIEFNISNFAEGIDASTDENVTDFNRAANSYNFEYKNGALTEGIGFEDLTLPKYHDEGSEETRARFFFDEGMSTDIVKVAHYKCFDNYDNMREDRLFVITSDFVPSYCRLITTTPAIAPLYNIELSECPKMANYRTSEDDVFLFYNDTDKVISWDGLENPVTRPNGATIYGFCIFNNKVAAIPSGERLSIRIEGISLLNWTEVPTENAKIITLDSERGYINKLLVFNGYMFVVRDFGVTRIDTQYNISHLLSSGSRMYANTCCMCGDKALILGKDGLYEFSNISAHKLNLNINRLLNGVANQYAVAAFRNGIYYLSCRLNFGDGKTIGCESGNYKNNALIAYDTYTNQYTICRGIDIIDLSTIQFDSADKLLACFNGTYSKRVGQITSDGKMFGSSQTRFWASPLSDMGFSDKLKYVKELSVMSKYDITIKVYSEIESREFSIKGSNIISRVPVRIKGKQIGVTITSTTEKAYISNLKLSANLIDNEYV